MNHVREGMGKGEGRPVRRSAPFRQAAKIEAPAEFVIAPPAKRIDVLRGEPYFLRDAPINFSETAHIPLNGRCEKPVEVLPPARIGELQRVCRKIMKTVPENRARERHL